MARAFGWTTAVVVAGVLAQAGEVQAVAAPGEVAPAFTKPEYQTGVQRSLSDYLGKVVVLVEFGYNCPTCLGDRASVESELWQHYQATKPGEVQVIGVDVWNGTEPQVAAYRSGTTFPLLRNGGLSSGGNLNTLYGPNDNYVVVNKQGIVRYNSYPIYAHNDRYRPSELRACIDSLVTQLVDVPGAGRGSSAAFAVAPNPFRDGTTFELVVPGNVPQAARIDVFDLTGRRVATPFDGIAGAGRSSVRWDVSASGVLAAGVYLARAVVGEDVHIRRVVLSR